MTKADALDPANWQLDPATVSATLAAAPKAVLPKAKKKWEKRYTVVPYAWQERLRDCTAISTYRLALYLAYEWWRNGGLRIRLSNAVIAAEGVGRTAKLDSLRELERLGLVQVDWRSRKAPLVTCLLMDGLPERR
jgi:hypothetical protein